MNKQRHAPSFSFRNCAGFSLLEIMLAGTLGLVLTGAMITLYLDSKRQYLFDEQWSRLQENGRLALRLISRDIAMAGFYGGTLVPAEIEPVPVSDDCNSRPWALDTGSPVSLIDNYAGDTEVHTTDGLLLGCLATDTLVSGSDALLIKRTSAQASLQSGVVAPELPRSSTDRWYLSQTAQQSPRWRKLRPSQISALAETGEVDNLWQAVARIYYLRRYSNPDDRDDGLPALCMEALEGDAMRTQCLVEGVEAMQFEFGIDTDGDGLVNRYTESPTQEDWPGLLSARVYLLLRSIQPLAGATERWSYVLGRSHYQAPQDGYLRRVFTATVVFRNRHRPIGDHPLGNANEAV